MKIRNLDCEKHEFRKTQIYEERNGSNWFQSLRNQGVEMDLNGK